MHRARRRNDQIAVEEANRSRATVGGPDFRLNRAGDHVHNLLGALFPGHAFLILVAAATSAAEDALAASAASTAPAAAVVRLCNIEVRSDKIRHFHDQILDR